jgi:fumarylacetoacetate (FAA) hydrolase family protein
VDKFLKLYPLLAKALDLGKADIFEQESELGRGIDAESERDCAARSVGRGQQCSVSTSPAWAEPG